MENKRPLKNFKSGMELEWLIMDNNGKIIFEADKLIQKIKEKDSDVQVVPECGYNMLELNNYPEVEPEDMFRHLINSMDVIYDTLDENEMKLYPLAMYPGEFEPRMRTNKKIYEVKEKIFGREKFLIAGRSVSFHMHYTLPKGVFDKNTLFLKKMINSKLKYSLMSVYNLAIAADPVWLGLMASSPYYQGKHLGKDSRAFAYRGGKKLKYLDGYYANLPLIGQLSPYKQTQSDLIYSIDRRVASWKRQIKKAGFEPKTIMKEYKSLTDIYWGPVKINKHDTLEQRGIDKNYIDLVVATAVLNNYLLDKIQKDFIKVIPSDIGMEEPFKLEGDDLFIAPHTYVRNTLQYESAKNGLESKEVYEYCKRFVALAKKLTPKSHYGLAKPLFDVVEEKKSVADDVLKMTKKMGYSKEDKLPKKVAAELALKIEEHGRKRYQSIKKEIQKLL